MHVTLRSPCIYKRGGQGPFQTDDRRRIHTQFDSSRASVSHFHILRPGSFSLSHQLVTPYYKHLGARQYKTLLPTRRRVFFGPNQYKSFVFFLHTIRISYAQTLIHLSGLGPLTQTPTHIFDQYINPSSMCLYKKKDKTR
jgi:hypothetical protein